MRGPAWVHKMDFLGLKNLNIITDCMHLITERYGIKIDPYHLPFETEVFERMYADGDTDFYSSSSQTA